MNQKTKKTPLTNSNFGGMGWTTIGNNASSMLMIPLMVALIGFGGVKLTTLVLGLFLILTGILNQFFVKDIPEDCGLYPDNITPEMEQEYDTPSLAASASAASSGKWTTARILRCKEFWIIAICCALMMCGNVCCIVYSTVRIQEFGFTQTQSVWINTIFALLACVGSVVWGWMDQKYGTKKAVALFCIVFAAASFINVAASSMDYNVPLMFVSLFMFYWCIGGNANWPTGRRFRPALPAGGPTSLP